MDNAKNCNFGWVLFTFGWVLFTCWLGPVYFWSALTSALTLKKAITDMHLRVCIPRQRLLLAVS